MKSKAIGLVLLAAVNCIAGDPTGNWEAQTWYDIRLYSALCHVMEIVGDFPQKCDHLVTDEVVFGYGVEKYDLGDEFVLAKDIGPYSYFIKAVSPKGIIFAARNKYGGRDYIYDSEWNVAYYEFLTPIEAQRIGQTVIKWLTTETERESDPPYGSEWRNIVTALGYRGCYTDLMDYEYGSFDILGTFGSFLPYDELRPQVWEIVLGGKVYADDVGREKCVRGILSRYPSYSSELQKEVLEKVAKYLESADDEKTKYSKKIAEFILEKGGSIPDRRYWVYDTDWVPFQGTGLAFQKGTVRYKAGVEVSPDDVRKRDAKKESVL